MQATGGDLVARTLSAFGIEVAFGLHGGHLDSLLLGCRRAGIRLVDTRHEAVAVNAADGYARVTGRIGVAFATAGSGFSNAVAGLGPAYVDRSPVLLLTSSPPLRDAETNTLQGSVDQVALAAPVVKWAHRVTAVREIPRLDGLAVRKALAGPPGPVVVDIPIDVLFDVVEEHQAEPGGGARLGYPPAPAPQGVAEAIELLRAAQRPVIIAGGGLRGAEVPSGALVALAEHTGIPVFHPGMIVGAMPPDHPLNGYVARNLGPLTAQGQGPDAALLLGSRFGLYLGGRGGGLIPLDAKIIQLDVDAAELGRLRPVDVGLTADVGLALPALLAAAREAPDWPDRSEWAELAAGQHRQPPPFAAEPIEVAGRMHPYHAVREILRCLDPQATFVVDVLFNNAGITGSQAAARCHETPIDEWDRVLGTNLRGPFLMTRAVLPVMLAAGGGHVINLVSIAGIVATRGRCAYTASKGGALMFTKSIAADYAADGIRCNAVCPGWVHTPMTRWRLDDPELGPRATAPIPMGRVAQPVEIAEAVGLLASEKLAYVTGLALVIDGGMTSTIMI